MGVLPPGQHTLDATEIPFLGMFVDWATNSNAFKAEIYFVGTREFPSCRFGGRLDEVQDPQTGLIVTLRTFGEYALRVIDPTKLILNLVGTVDVTNNAGDHRLGRPATAQGHPHHGHHPADVRRLADPGPVDAQPGHRGGSRCRPPTSSWTTTASAITRFGNVDVNLDDDDNARLKKLAGDTAYSRLAGGFLQAAQAEALQGAGEGMAQGGAAVTPMFLGRRLRRGQQDDAAAGTGPDAAAARARLRRWWQGYVQPPAQPAAPQPAAPPQHRPAGRPGRPGRAAGRRARRAPAAGTVACGNCHSQVQVGAKFCTRVRHPDAEALHELQRRPERRPPSSARSAAPRPARRPPKLLPQRRFSSGARTRARSRPALSNPALPSPWRRAAPQTKGCPNGPDRVPVVQGPERDGPDQLHDVRRAAGQEGHGLRLRLDRSAAAAGHDGVPVLQLHLPDRGRDRAGGRTGAGPG